MKLLKNRTFLFGAAFGFTAFPLLFIACSFVYSLNNLTLINIGLNGGDKDYGIVEIPPSVPIPSVSLKGKPDKNRGISLNYVAKNFRFTPECADGESVMGEGHLHIFVDGKKVARGYVGDNHGWHYLPGLESGKRTITVELTANGHQTYAVNGKKVSSSIVVNIP